ncbi:hypothetical protein D3C72_2597180 [compost metagenome]
MGAPTHVLINGQLAVEGGKYVGEPATGRYLPRKPSAPVRNPGLPEGVATGF